jgi:hypothetical protein
MKEEDAPLPVTASRILFYQAEDGTSRIEVRLDEGTVWLPQVPIAELFQTTKQNISLHTRNIIDEGELQPGSVVKEYLTTAADGKQYRTKFYNLAMTVATIGAIGRASSDPHLRP